MSIVITEDGGLRTGAPSRPRGGSRLERRRFLSSLAYSLGEINWSRDASDPDPSNLGMGQGNAGGVRLTVESGSTAPTSGYVPKPKSIS